MKMDCIPLENGRLHLEIARSVGPRILSLSLDGGPNLLAELPDVVTHRPDGKTYHFHGGHRLWLSPEDAILSYELEDEPVEIVPIKNGLRITKSIGAETGIEKSIQVVVLDQTPKAVVTHKLKNCGEQSVRCAPWAITQFRTGGVAILPMNNVDTGFLPNRNLVLWFYTDLANCNVQWGHQALLLHAAMRSPFKVGLANPVGWLAYWLDGILFVKAAGYNPQASYPDFGCSSECYCNDQFIELETLGPLQEIPPGGCLRHVETWSLFQEPDRPENESDVQRLIEKLGSR
jgi:hypothetical protein